MADPKAKASALPITVNKLDPQSERLLVREHFDWWDDVEHEIAMNTAAPTTTPTGSATAIQQHQEHEHLLMRDNFDWWDDVERDIPVDTTALATNSTGPTTATKSDDKLAQPPVQEQFDWWQDVEDNITTETKTHAMKTKHHTIHNEFLRTNGFTAIKFNDWCGHLPQPETFDFASDVKAPLCSIDSFQAGRLREWLDLPCHSNAMKQVSPPEAVDVLNSVDHAFFESQEPMDTRQSVNVPEPVSPPKTDEESMETAINEYEWRSLVSNQDDHIHHWNWFGRPVYQPSTTPPVESLAFMQAEPKAPKGSDELLVTSIMNRAIHQIDPVILKVDRGNEAILQMHGSAMIRACDGLTYTHYSLHGTWTKYDFSTRRMTIPDMEAPALPQFAIGNGIFANGPLISRKKWMEWRNELVAATQTPALTPRKMTWNASPSKLNIESLPSTIDKKLSSPSFIHKYTLGPLAIVRTVVQKAFFTAKEVVHKSISFPIGILKKSWHIVKAVFNPSTAYCRFFCRCQT
ncbi:uncharacterized protein N7479_010726 [Penicillium vulpinum]|uniref:uncharacterized protein n=1 Tax=Penicillium vulpinum TaxID=29845 RepID=UPI0025498315|nr:uncharacterized protein N7479_010726 [Penicillium vulpinum]KAJ5952313.1 hypothetical protein N7479_010726 [Penicillium vulpinum]